MMIENVSIGMIFLLLVVLVVGVFYPLHIGMLKKILLGGSLSGALVAMAFYIYTNQSNNEDINAIIEQAFLDNKTLDCEGFLINQEDFTLITQTYMLVGKAQTPMSNIAIAANKCKIVEQSKESEQTIDGHMIIDAVGRD